MSLSYHESYGFANIFSFQKRDIATATATFGFVRNLGSAISIVVGSVIFQNQMKSKQPMLRSALGPEVASAFGGGSAGANVGIIASLPENEKAIARSAFADSLGTMWIMYVVFAGIGLVVSGFITKNVLTKQHEETRTGLDEEQKRRLEREAERKEKKARKEAGKVEPLADVEKGAAAEEE